MWHAARDWLCADPERQADGAPRLAAELGREGELVGAERELFPAYPPGEVDLDVAGLVLVRERARRHEPRAGLLVLAGRPRHAEAARLVPDRAPEHAERGGRGLGVTVADIRAGLGEGGETGAPSSRPERRRGPA